MCLINETNNLYENYDKLLTITNILDNILDHIVQKPK